MKQFLIDQLQAMTLPQIIAYFIAIFTLILLLIIHTVDRKDISLGLKGENGRWEIPELAGRVWLIVFVSVIVISILGVSVDDKIWWSLDTVFGIITIGKSYVRAKELEHSKDKSEEPPKQDPEL
jgi:amino acid transporter